jgi:hypothetical protein
MMRPVQPNGDRERPGWAQSKMAGISHFALCRVGIRIEETTCHRFRFLVVNFFIFDRASATRIFVSVTLYP